MALQTLPAEGSTSWYDWAAGIDTAAKEATVTSAALQMNVAGASALRTPNWSQ